MGGRNYFFLIKNYCAAYSRCFVFSSLRKISNFASPRCENFNSRAITKIPSSRGEETRSIQGRRVWNIRARIRIKTIERRRKCRNRPFIPDQSAILIRRLLLKPIRAPFSLATPFIDLSRFYPSFLHLFLSSPSLPCYFSRLFPALPIPSSLADLTSCHFSALKFLWCVQFPT